MKKILLILPVLFLFSCGNATNDANQSTSNTDTTTTTTDDNTNPTTTTTDAPQTGAPRLGKMVGDNYEPGEDEVYDILLLKSMTDGGYPQYTIEAQPHRQKNTVSFYLNAEDYQGSSITELEKAKDKNVQIAYWIQYDNNIARLMAGDVEILSNEGIQPEPKFKKVEGKLIAAEVTNSDLPGVFAIERADGKKVYFPYYVTADMVAHNGEQVTAYYATDANMVISYIKVLDN